jgi:hypothetical protein
VTGRVHADGTVDVAIGRFDAGTQLVVELAQPHGSRARFELRVDRAVVRPTSTYRDLASYDLTANATYEVAVTIARSEAIGALGLNVRPHATLVPFPEVLAMPTSRAQSALGKAKLFVTTVRTVCSESGDFAKGAVIRVIDMDRQAVLGVSGVLVGPDQEPVRRVASGTNVAIEASTGARCTAGLRPQPFAVAP